MKVYRNTMYALFEDVQIGELFDHDCEVWLKIDPNYFNVPCNAVNINGRKFMCFGDGVRVTRYPNALLVLDGDLKA